MKNERQIADEILDQAVAGNISAANSMIDAAVSDNRRKNGLRAHAFSYLLVVFALAALCLGIDALDGHIIDWL